MEQDPVEKLHTACSNGTPREVVYLVKRYPAIINEVAYNESLDGTLAALHIAVEGGKVEVVKVLLENGAKADVADSEGYTPLQMACSNGNIAIVELLLGCGADPDLLVEHMGSSTLHEAVIGGCLDVVEAVYNRIKDKSRVNSPDNKGWVPLHSACQSGHTAIVQFLLEHGARFDMAIASGRTALHLAAFEGHVECARLLIGRGCEVDTQDEEGWTAVVLASQEGHVEIVRLICDKSPDFTLTSQLGRNAIHSACFHGHIGVVQCILNTTGGPSICNNRDIDGWTPLHLAAQEGFKDIVKVLLTDPRCSQEVSLNEQANNGRTAVHNAALKGKENVVMQLIEAKANLNIKDTKGWTALHVACQHGHFKIAELLLESGEIRVNDTIDSGRNGLHLAAYEGFFEIAQLLVEKGIDCRLQDKDKWSPLHLCVQEGHVKIVELLMTVLSVDVNARAHNKRIPLHSACFYGRLEIAKLLLNRNSHLETQDEKGWTPLHLCSQEGHLQVAREILKRKPNVNIQADNLRQPLHLACMKGHTEIVKALMEAGAEIERGDSKNWTPLCIACQHNNLAVANVLVDRGANVNVEISGGRKPVHLAAFDGHYDICKLLKTKGAELNHQDSDGWSALHLSAQEGHLAVVQLLVEEGANITLCSSGGRIPLHMCASSGHVDIANYLLQQPQTVVDSKDTSDWTPLHSASNKGHLDVVKLLVAKGANINSIIAMGRNSLHLCAFNGYPEVAAYLLDKGIDPSLHDNNGWTSLHLSAQEGHFEIVKSILSKGADPTALAGNGRGAVHSAASYGHTDIVKLLLQYSPTLLNVLDTNKWSPLHTACNNGHLSTAQVLLTQGADVHQVINTGRNCLHLAAFNGAAALCQLLLDLGCELNAKDQDGWTPLHLAGQEGQIDTVKVLLEKGANIEQLSNDGRTSLQLSCLKGHSSVVQKLIQYGAKCNVADNFNWTPLIDASAGGFLELVDLLVENGAMLDVQNTDNSETALHQALLNKHTQVARYLVFSGANVNLPNKGGLTALQLAQQNGHKDLVDEMTHNRSRKQTREEKALKVKIPAIAAAFMKLKSSGLKGPVLSQLKSDTRSSDGQASTITTSADKESVKNIEKEEFHSGVTGTFNVSDEELKSVQQLIDNRYQDKPRAKGIVFIIGVTGAAGTDVDVENMSKTFRDGLEFATFREENVTCSRLACIVKAAATFKYPLKCNFIAFYFAGHGGLDEHHRPFLKAAEKNSHNDEKLLIHDNILNQFQANFSKSRRKKLIFFFDCCLSSANSSDGKSFAMKSPVSCILAYATSIQQKSIGNSKTGGAWTSQLCNRITEKISLSEVLEKVNEDLRNDGFEQVPHYESSTGPVYLNGKVVASVSHHSTLRLHRQQLQDAISGNVNTLISIAGGLCYGNVINSKIKDDVIRARTNNGAAVLLDCLEVIVNEKATAMSKIFEVLEHEQVLANIVKTMKEEEERKKKAAYEVAGIQDVLEEYKKFEKKKASETEHLKKELALVMEKMSLMEREQKVQRSLTGHIAKLNSELEKVEEKDRKREQIIASIQEKYRRESEQLSTEYKMKLHQLEENMQRELTGMFTEFSASL